MPNLIWICLLSHLPGTKNCNFGQILTFGGLQPSLPIKAKFGVLEQTKDLHLCDKFCLDWLIPPPSGREKNPNFAVFWTFCGVITWWRSEKAEHRYTTTNLPLSNGIKIISTIQRLYGDIMCTNSNVQMRDKQTNRQTETQRFLVTMAACNVQTPSNMVQW